MDNPYFGRVDEQGYIGTETTPAENLADAALIAVCKREPMTDGPELRQAFRDEHQRLLSDAIREAYNARDSQRVKELSGWVETADRDLAWMLQARAGVFGQSWQQFYDRDAYQQERLRVQCRAILRRDFEQAMRDGDDARMDELAVSLEMIETPALYPRREGGDLKADAPF